MRLLQTRDYERDRSAYRRSEHAAARCNVRASEKAVTVPEAEQSDGVRLHLV